MDTGGEENICGIKSLKVSKNTMKNKTVCATKYLKSYISTESFLWFKLYFQAVF